MKLTVKSDNICGTARMPSSKSAAHRAIIAAAIAKGTSRISGVTLCDDVKATLNGVCALGANVRFDSDDILITGIENAPQSAEIDCVESGSTVRFLIPLAATYGVNATFVGHGRLPERPLDDIIDALTPHGISCVQLTQKSLPLSISGISDGSEYRIAGNISSQYLTGLLLSSCVHGGEIKLSTDLESAPYVDMTVDMIRRFGGSVSVENGKYTVSGSLQARDIYVEGDWSSAAFLFEAAALGGEVNISGLDEKSYQGDKKCAEIFRKIGADVNFRDGIYNVRKNQIRPFDLDASQVPDLVPAIAVTLAFADGKSLIYNARRLRIKESDRLKAVADNLEKMGIKTELTDDSLTVFGGIPHSAEIDSFNDHRIAMAFSAAAVAINGGITVNGAQSVAKSFPDFYKVFNSVGGDVSVINNR